MTLYKINIGNREYTEWILFNATTLEQATIDDFKLDDHKLFSNDVFTYNKRKDGTSVVEIVHSSARISEHIPAVLILADNKTYGRETKTNSNKGRLLYKCIPDDIRIPVFLVPYEIKHLGFSKVLTNLYVTIRFKSWTDKHPIATINQNIGPVGIVDNFYEYQLYCKSLNASIQKFNKATTTALNETPNHDAFITSVCDKHPQVEDRTSWKTFTIDPSTSLDYDDGFSIKKLDNNQILLSIYIANVTIWMDSLNLWSSFSQRISTIYLPDRKRPMLPSVLSDCLCSLQSNVRRFAFVVDIVLDADFKMVSIKYSNCLIKVFRNFAYEEPDLLIDPDYNFLLETTKQMTNTYKYISNVRNSHDLVGYLMILMNYQCAQELLKTNSGIFRSTIISKKVELPDGLPDDVNKFIKIWNSSCGQYVNISSVDEEDRERLTKHELLEMDAYIHITSPIRRLVDLLNMIKFQQNHRLINLSADAIHFYDKWNNQMEYINVTMRAIRKVQTDCNLLDTCIRDVNMLEKTFDGYCFDKLVRNDGLYQFIVFLPELKMVSRITMRDNLDNYEKRQYKLFLFNDEQRFKKKIRLQLMDKRM
jgi:exoribonuclease R